ncbi:olfactory receptor 5F1-like [Bombina bombina]|uniref:olfactory receptor 5F1-like n=1 Tax=Bombina bombina TaxID=8345 RepID=UPI00235A8A3D|nr:olfactory receptor 5F1-like [Bombina bombina]
MDTKNVTAIAMFILQGFAIGYKQQIFLFVMFLFIYLLSITFNTLIIFMVRTERRLHKPMYFFLSNFSFLEIMYISDTVPKMMSDFLSQKKTISVACCITQLYFLFLFGSIENLLLVIMSFDRYVAICYPLQYVIIMSERFCRLLAAAAWMFSVVILMIIIIPVTQLSFCDSNIIDHVFCDFAPVVKISCQGATLCEIVFFLIAGLVILGCFTLIMASYIHIIIIVYATSSGSGLRNAFATCASHFIVVFIYYGTVIFMYVRPSVMVSFHEDKVISVFYSAVTPLLNPVIYSLRNKDVKESIIKLFRI